MTQQKHDPARGERGNRDSAFRRRRPSARLENGSGLGCREGSWLRLLRPESENPRRGLLGGGGDTGVGGREKSLASAGPVFQENQWTPAWESSSRGSQTASPHGSKRTSRSLTQERQGDGGGTGNTVVVCRLHGAQPWSLQGRRAPNHENHPQSGLQNTESF